MQRREFLRFLTGIAGTFATGRVPAASQVWPMPDVIVLLPGITGSVLRKDGDDLWAFSAEGILGALRSLGRNLDALTLQQDSPDAEDLGDGITAHRLFEDVHLIPGLWKIDGYTRLRQTIRRSFRVEPGRNLFEFPYDWRRDNRSAARRLGHQSHDWLKRWRASGGTADAKLILIAHSMGGLVSRYFLECLEGWRDTRLLITLGTPYRGSLNALNFLCNGYKKRIGSLTLVDLTGLMRSFTSVHQLLPTFPCYDGGDGTLAVVGETQAIPGLDADKAAAALSFHREIARAVETNQKIGTYREDGYNIVPIAGIFQPTLQSARRDAGRVVCSMNYPGRQEDGDGTVPRRSATPPELTGQGRENFTAEIHGSLQNAGGALEHISGVLSQPLSYRATFRDPSGVRLSLRVDDLYAEDEPILMTSTYAPPDAPLVLQAIIVDAVTGQEVTRVSQRTKGDGIQGIRVPQLASGTYRVTLRSDSASVTDVFAVV